MTLPGAPAWHSTGWGKASARRRSAGEREGEKDENGKNWAWGESSRAKMKACFSWAGRFSHDSRLFLGGLLFFLMKACFSWVGCFSLKENKVFDRSGIWGPCPPEPILSYNCTCSPGPYSYDDKVL